MLFKYILLCQLKLNALSFLILREQEKRQLTIFYGGKVLVFNDFPAEKAKDLMQMSSKGAPTVQSSVLLPSATTATLTDSTKVSAMPAPPTAVVNGQKSAAGN
jgi:jasmonate ZIM domain-containing protein